jgi:MATE family multidrug resistance protein
MEPTPATTSFKRTASRGDEVRRIARVAGPLIINNLAIAGMQFADAVMAGSLGARELAAVAVGGSVWFLGLTMCLGLMMAISPIAARHYGAGRPALIGRYTRQGLWLSLFLGLSYIALVYSFVDSALAYVGVSPDFRELTISYARIIVLGAPAICAFFAFRFTTEGIGETRPIMYTSLVALVSNVFLNWMFMFGNLGAPELGAPGAAVASAITMFLIMIILGSYLYIHPRYKPLEIFKRVPPMRVPVLREIVVLGMPIAITVTAEAGLFAAVSIMMGTRGTDITAAHQIAINFASTMFMVPLAFSSATTVRVGQALGAGLPVDARKAGFTGIVMAGVFMACSALFLLVFRDMVVGIYTSDPQVKAIAISMLLMAAVFQVADGIQIGAAGALRGYKDTTVPMLLNMISYWVLAFPLAYVAAVVYTMPPAYIWGGFVIGLTVAALLLTTRYNRVSRVA